MAHNIIITIEIEYITKGSGIAIEVTDVKETIYIDSKNVYSSITNELIYRKEKTPLREFEKWLFGHDESKCSNKGFSMSKAERLKMDQSILRAGARLKDEYLLKMYGTTDITMLKPEDFTDEMPSYEQA